MIEQQGLLRCWRCDRCLGEVEGMATGTLLVSCRRCGAKNRIVLSPVTHALNNDKLVWKKPLTDVV